MLCTFVALDQSLILYCTRTGRLDRLVYVPPPNVEYRMVTTRFSEDIDLRTVSSLTNNFTGVDLMALVRKAGLCALKASRVRQRETAFFSAYTCQSERPASEDTWSNHLNLSNSQVSKPKTFPMPHQISSHQSVISNC
jgi:ATP-dependent 26S proteasome regulatory subunit